MSRIRRTSTILLGALVVAGAVPTRSLTVRFAASSPEHEAATDEYRALWRQDGARIVDALERISGLEFPVDAVEVTVIDGASWAGTDRIGMRATYPPETKRGTLVHELGHILLGDLVPLDESGDEVVEGHRVLFLFLYDVWVDLWGAEFADGQVEVESARRGRVDYEGAWNEVLGLTVAERAKRFRDLVARWSGS